MTLTTLGDLTSHFMLRRHNVALRSEAQRLSAELATGRITDPIRNLGGDFSVLADLDHRAHANAAFRQATQEAVTMTDGLQLSMERLQDLSVDLASALITSVDSGLTGTGLSVSKQAKGSFDRAIAALNTQVAGRSLLAGNRVENPALANPDTILSDLRAALSGLTDPAAISAAADAWFDTPGAGFDSIAYTGATVGIAPFRVADGETADLDLRADHAAIRAVLKPIALAALAGDTSLGFDTKTRHSLLRESGTALFDAQDGVTAVRADLGVTQARLEETAVRLASENLALEEAQAGLLSVDPYETATRLEEVQFNLESLYTVTVRLSRLSLTEYM